jgi:hypothetical protein
MEPTRLGGRARSFRQFASLRETKWVGLSWLASPSINDGGFRSKAASDLAYLTKPDIETSNVMWSEQDWKEFDYALWRLACALRKLKQSKSGDISKGA